MTKINVDPTQLASVEQALEVVAGQVGPGMVVRAVEGTLLRLAIRDWQANNPGSHGRLKRIGRVVNNTPAPAPQRRRKR